MKENEGWRNEDKIKNTLKNRKKIKCHIKEKEQHKERVLRVERLKKLLRGTMIRKAES